MCEPSQNVNTDDIIRILVATDNHLGYAEKDPVRGEDSFNAFEEILDLAVTKDVDFILLGGDLFHDAVPSQNTLHKCIKLLRRYTFGDKPISVEILENGAHSFHNAINQSVNYEDPNLNISIPVFSIHGNHDDPSGFGRLSSLDLLSTSGLVNYFGRWTDLTKINIKPIMLRKGKTQLALYGLSHIHDARLARLFENCKVTIECPNTEEGEWFHLMVLHQNRADRGPKNYLPEEILPEFLNLVIWGHEHDCRIEPERNSKKDFYVSQPGSSVPTSLAEGESIKKHVGLLEIYKNKFQMIPLPLQTVRPFVFESVNLWDLSEQLGLDEGDAGNKIKLMAEKRIENMIEKSKSLLTGHPKQPTKPLIRLRLVFSEEEQMFNAIRFGQMFNERVANATDMIHFKKFIKKIKKDPVDFDKDAIQSAFDNMEIGKNSRVEHLIERYFENAEDSKALQVINSKVLSEMCYRLVDRGDCNAADQFVRICKKKSIEHLMETLPSNENIDEALTVIREQITPDSIGKILDDPNFKSADKNTSVNKNVRASAVDTIEDLDFEMDDESTPNPRGRGRAVKTETKKSPSTRGRGRARGRGSRGAATSSNTTKHTMPKLNVSVSSSASNKSTKQPTLLDQISARQSTRQSKVKTYVISDDSD